MGIWILSYITMAYLHLLHPLCYAYGLNDGEGI